MKTFKTFLVQFIIFLTQYRYKDFKQALNILELYSNNLKINKTMKEQAQELIDFGNSKEIAHGRGMLKVIDALLNILTKKTSDGECIDDIYTLINNK